MMRAKQSKKPFGVLDLGSSKLACLIVEHDNDRLHLRGQALHASLGIRQGEIIDMDGFSHAVGKVIETAERHAGVNIDRVHIVTPAGQPRLHQTKTDIELHSPLITRRDMARLASRQAEQPFSESADEIVILQRHLSEYLVDGQGPIINPNGMSGSRLTAISQILTMSASSYNNFRHVAAHNHLQLGQTHHSAACAALACLSADERELGSMMIDFGGGTTGLAVYIEGRLRAVATVKMGGQNITRDIARMLSLSTAEAERLKALEGSVLPAPPALNMTYAGTGTASASAFPAQGDNFVLTKTMSQHENLTLVSGQTIQRQFLNDIIRTRLEEILEAVEATLTASKLPSPRHFNLAVTGGASQLTGLSDFLSAYWQKPVSVKSPLPLSGLDGHISGGSFAASIGMARFVQHQDQQSSLHALSNHGMLGRLRDWFKQNI